MSTPGPTRIILIRSGRYDLAEIALGNSVHIVGDNNVGKTSAISTLQFLYIASFNEMRFSRPWEESARYYFQSDTSYVLFETLTKDGHYVTFGLSGRGQLGGYQVDRFAYDGPYNREDYLLEDNRVRQFDEVKSRIASGRFFKLLEPSDIRAAVVGESKIPEINMGIVPLKDTSRYGDFIYLFKNLLRLSDLSQRDIKDTLLTVYKKDIRHSAEVDLTREYGDTYASLHAEGEKLRTLKHVVPTIHRLKELKDKKEKSKRDLPALYAEIVSRKARRHTELQQSMEAAATRLKDIEAGELRINEELNSLRKESQQLAAEAALASDWIAKFDLLSKEIENFLPDIETSLRQNLEEEIEDLIGKTHSPGDPNALKSKKDELEAKLKSLQLLIEKQHLLFGTKLQEIAGIEATDTIAKVLNPSLLKLPVEPEAVQIRNEQDLSHAITSLTANIRNDNLSAFGVSIPLDLIKASTVSNIASLEAELAETEAEFRATTTAYETAINVAALKERLNARKAELFAATERHRRYMTWKKQQAEQKQKQLSLKNLQAESIENENAQTRLINSQSENVRLKLVSQGQINKLREEQNELDKVRPAPPDSSWPAGSVDPDWPVDIGSLSKLYTETLNQYRGIDVDLREYLREAESQYTDGFDGISPDEKIAAAIDLIDSMKDQEHAYSTHLGNVIKGMQASFQRLFEALYALREAADSFNKQIGKVSISSLRRLSLEIIENKEATKSYRAIVDMQKADLFADLTETEKAIERIYDVIRNKPVIKLSDWFGVRFVIETADGARKEYDDLSAIESNGTTMAIKTLVNMVLIRALMRDKRPYRIPFYIDEATQIDTQNLREVVSLANEMGFCPVLASTSPVSVAENLNFVQIMPNQRAIIDPRRSIQRRALADAQAETA